MLVRQFRLDHTTSIGPPLLFRLDPPSHASHCKGTFGDLLPRPASRLRSILFFESNDNTTDHETDDKTDDLRSGSQQNFPKPQSRHVARPLSRWPVLRTCAPCTCRCITPRSRSIGLGWPRSPLASLEGPWQSLEVALSPRTNARQLQNSIGRQGRPDGRVSFRDESLTCKSGWKVRTYDVLLNGGEDQA